MPPLPKFLTDARWPSTAGLIVALVFALVSVPIVLATLGAPVVARLVATAATCALIVILWLRERRLPRFRRSEIGILVSLSAKGSVTDREQVDDVLARLTERLSEEAASPELIESGIPVRVRQLRPHELVGDAEAARKTSTAARAIFLVWASGTAGSVEGKSGIVFPRINFLVHHRPLTKSEQGALKTELELVHIPSRNYDVMFDNDVVDIEIATQNLAQVARYQVALALAATGVRTPAISLFDSVIREGDKTLPYVAHARKVAAILRVLPWTIRPPEPGDDAELVERALVDSEAAVRLNPDLIEAYAVVASCRFILGDRAGAHAANGSIRSRASGMVSSIFNLNRAVFYLHEGHYDLALREYRRAERLGVSPEIVQSPVRWLYAAVDHLGPQYLLGLAFLNDTFFDQSAALGQYQLALEIFPQEATASRRFVTDRIAALRQP